MSETSEQYHKVENALGEWSIERGDTNTFVAWAASESDAELLLAGLAALQAEGNDG